MWHRFTIHQKTPFTLPKLHHGLSLVLGSFWKLGCRILRSCPGLIPDKEMMVQVAEPSKTYKIGLYKELLGLYSPFFFLIALSFQKFFLIYKSQTKGAKICGITWKVRDGAVTCTEDCASCFINYWDHCVPRRLICNRGKIGNNLNV